jgi:hypothetical protein
VRELFSINDERRRNENPTDFACDNYAGDGFGAGGGTVGRDAGAGGEGGDMYVNWDWELVGIRHVEWMR